MLQRYNLQYCSWNVLSFSSHLRAWLLHDFSSRKNWIFLVQLVIYSSVWGYHVCNWVFLFMFTALTSHPKLWHPLVSRMDFTEWGLSATLISSFFFFFLLCGSLILCEWYILTSSYKLKLYNTKLIVSEWDFWDQVNIFGGVYVHLSHLAWGVLLSPVVKCVSGRLPLLDEHCASSGFSVIVSSASLYSTLDSEQCQPLQYAEQRQLVILPVEEGLPSFLLAMGSCSWDLNKNCWL